MENARHTPAPWFANLHHEVRSGGRFYVHITAGKNLVPVCTLPAGVDGYGREEGRANAELIVKAVNAHETMRSALLAARKRMRNCRGAIESDQVVDKDVHGSLTKGIADIDAVLAGSGWAQS